MELNTKGLNALSYFSIFFAPFLLPIIIFFVSQDKAVRYHAKRALLSHLIPVALGFIIAIVTIISIFVVGPDPTSATTMISFTYIIIGLFVIGSLFILIWNVIQGIKVLR